MFTYAKVYSLWIFKRENIFYVFQFGPYFCNIETQQLKVGDLGSSFHSCGNKNTQKKKTDSFSTTHEIITKLDLELGHRKLINSKCTKVHTFPLYNKIQNY